VKEKRNKRMEKHPVLKEKIGPWNGKAVQLDKVCLLFS
jgi:hypothetical protein